MLIAIDCVHHARPEPFLLCLSTLQVALKALIYCLSRFRTQTNRTHRLPRQLHVRWIDLHTQQPVIQLLLALKLLIILRPAAQSPRQTNFLIVVVISGRARFFCEDLVLLVGFLWNGHECGSCM